MRLLDVHKIYSCTIEEIEESKLAKLIEGSFRKRLVFDYFTELIKKIIIEENYSGAAIVQNNGGFNYLDKFVVDNSIQGNGLGSKLFSEVLKQYPKLFWRAKKTNPANDWYVKKVLENNGGFSRNGKWTVFWIGDFNGSLDDIVRFAIEKRTTLIRENYQTDWKCRLS